MTAIDLFLSYHTADREAVEKVRQILKAQGLSTFVDYTNLTAGIPWPQALEQALDSVRAVAVFVGAEMGLWQKREMYFALDRQTKEEGAGRSFPVIPILIPGADVTFGFLFLNTWVDLRQDLTSAEAIEQLLKAVQGEGPEFDGSNVSNLSPYRELKSFGEEHAAFFFGREDFSQRLLDRVRSENGLVAVIGPSGSGKSSVVHAGLLPLLRRERPPARTWDAISFTPGEQPFHRFAAALIPLLEQGMTETDRLAEQFKLGDRLAEGTVLVADVVQRIIDKSKGTGRLLVIVDQFEELITLTSKASRSANPSTVESTDNRVAVSFVKSMMEALRVRAPIEFVLTLRADFYGNVIGLSRELSDRFEQCVVNVGPLTEAELQRAIKEPARKVGLSFEPELINRLLKDFGSEPGQLPLLEFTLWELWRKREARVMTHVAYERLGGVTKAIDRFAHAEFEKFNSDEQASVRRIFTRLVRLTPAGERGVDSRQRVALNELGGSSQDLVRRLSDARLIVTSRDRVSGQETVEVSHEALIREWGDLRTWLDEDREFLMWRQQLRLFTKAWQRTNHDEGGLLRGRQLEDAETWRNLRADDLSDDEKEFIGLSIEHRQKSLFDEEQRRLESERRRLEDEQRRVADEQRLHDEEQRRRKRRIGVVAGSLLVFALAFLAILLGVRASRQQRIALARTLLSPAISIMSSDRSKLDQAALLAIESLKFDDTNEAKGVLREAVTLLPKELSRSEVDCDGNATLSPGGLFLACLDKSRASVKVFSVADPARPVHPAYAEKTSEILTAAVSPDGKLLGIGLRDGGYRLIDIQSRSVKAEGDGSNSVVAFSEDGRYFAAASGNDVAAIQVTSLSENAPQVQPFRIASTILALAFSADGGFLAAAYESRPDTEVIVFNLSTRETDKISGGAAFPTLALSDGGGLIALPYLDKTVRVKDMKQGTEFGKVTHQQLAHSVAMTKDGKYAASGSDDGTARVFETGTGYPIALVPMGAPVESVAFTKENNLRVVSGKTVRTVNVFDRPAFQSLPGTLGISPGGKYRSALDETKSELVIVERATGKKALSVPASPDIIASDLVYSSDDEYLVLPDSGKGTTVYEFKNGKSYDNAAPGMVEQAISINGKKVAWSTAQGIQISSVGEAHEKPDVLEFPTAFLLQLSPDGTLIAAAGKDPVLSVFNVATKKKVFDVKSASAFNKATFSPDGRYLLTSSVNKELVLSEARAGKEIWRTKTTGNSLVLFSNKGEILATARGEEGRSALEVTLMDTASQVTLLRIFVEAQPVGMAFGHDDSYIDIFDGVAITRHYLATKDVVDQMCTTLLIRNFTPDEWSSFLPGNNYRRTCPNLP